MSVYTCGCRNINVLIKVLPQKPLWLLSNISISYHLSKDAKSQDAETHLAPEVSSKGLWVFIGLSNTSAAANHTCCRKCYYTNGEI